MSLIKELMVQLAEVDMKISLDGEESEELVVPGMGVASRNSIERHVRTMFSDLIARVQQPNPDWSTIQKLLTNSGLHAYLEALQQPSGE